MAEETHKKKFMKKYFTKYLIAEGDIKPPCIVLETLTTGEKELFQVDTENDIDLKNQILVKLYICSKDIQPGDKVLIGFPKEMKSEEDRFSFKVVGEVSDKSTWVKEGMEFDEEEVEIYAEDNFGLSFLKHLAGKIPIVKTWCAIKCSNCGHFH